MAWGLFIRFLTKSRFFILNQFREDLKRQILSKPIGHKILYSVLKSAAFEMKEIFFSPKVILKISLGAAMLTVY